MTEIHRDTITRLGVHIGQGCARLLDQKVRNLDSTGIQVDEIWALWAKRTRVSKLTDDPNQVGSVWTVCALDTNSKIVPSHRVGNRDSQNDASDVCG